MVDTHSHWNKTAAKTYIETKQDPDGAFTDPGLTADVLLALTNKGLGAIRNFDCGRGDTDFESHGKPIGMKQGSMRILDGYVVVARLHLLFLFCFGFNISKHHTAHLDVVCLILPRHM